MRRLVVLQPGYLPWIGYFDQMRRADVFVHYDDVQFDKHGWRNRNRVKGAKGAIWLTVPIRHSGRFGQSVLDVEIDDKQNWRRKHLATITQCYAQAPFLSPALSALEEIIERPWSRLIDLDLALIDWMAATLGITTQCHRASELGIAGDRNERLLNLCRHFGATHYLSGSAARDYLQVERFAESGITVEWHDYAHPVYPQLHGDFIPYLSTIDLIMNSGPHASTILSQSNMHSALDFAGARAPIDCE